jgi:acetyl-CoA C-acetyltransferase
LKAAFPAIADYALDDKGTTYRKLISTNIPTSTSTSCITPAIPPASSTARRDPAGVAELRQGARPEAARPRRRDGEYGGLADPDAERAGAGARKVLAKAGLTLDDIDLFEINEAFAVVAEKFIRDLKLDREKVNVNGGSIALGHPIGATGSILIGTVLDELERRDLKRGLVTMCAAGGMAPGDHHRAGLRRLLDLGRREQELKRNAAIGRQ